jgi:hypothetical protein
MYVLLLILVPVLFLYNPRFAMVALIAAIVAMYFERTRPAKRPRPRRFSESEYKPGYED